MDKVRVAIVGAASLPAFSVKLFASVVPLTDTVTVRLWLVVFPAVVNQLFGQVTWPDPLLIVAVPSVVFPALKVTVSVA